MSVPVAHQAHPKGVRLLNFLSAAERVEFQPVQAGLIRRMWRRYEGKQNALFAIRINK
jgi:hypothetical protein